MAQFVTYAATVLALLFCLSSLMYESEAVQEPFSPVNVLSIGEDFKVAGIDEDFVSEAFHKNYSQLSQFHSLFKDRTGRDVAVCITQLGSIF